jgi:hypothetical protein
MHFVNINIEVPDELVNGYDPTQILQNFIYRFTTTPRMKEDGAEFICLRTVGTETTDLGRLVLTTNCSLVHDKDIRWRTEPERVLGTY